MYKAIAFGFLFFHCRHFGCAVGGGCLVTLLALGWNETWAFIVRINYVVWLRCDVCQLARQSAVIVGDYRFVP